MFLHFHSLYLTPLVTPNFNPSFHANSHNRLPNPEYCSTNVEYVIVELMANPLVLNLLYGQKFENVPRSMCIHNIFASHILLEFIFSTKTLRTLQIFKNNLRPRLIFGMSSSNNLSCSKPKPCFLNPFAGATRVLYGFIIISLTNLTFSWGS
jgi:hypothetical protein